MKNHRELRGHREKQQPSVLSVSWYEKTDQLEPAKASKQSNNFNIDLTTFTILKSKLSNNVKSNIDFRSKIYSNS